VGKAPKSRKRPTFKVDLPVELADRLLFLARMVGSTDLEHVVERAVGYFDRAVCATLDGAKIVAHHKNDKSEDLNPCKY
jgi:hypothetical protein